MAIASTGCAGPRADSAMSGTELFSRVWSEEIWKEIQPEYEQLCNTMPQRIQEKATKRLLENAQRKEKKQKKERKEAGDDDGEEDDVEANIAKKILEKKMKEVMDDVLKHKERRNVYMNLAWTGPCANTALQSNILYEKVANMAIDLFIDPSKAVSASATDQASMGTAPADDSESNDKVGSQASLQERISSQAKRPWKIPAAVERGFEIPILVTERATAPDLGKFQRLGMDVVVNAVWLALFWAKKEQNHEAVSDLKKLILDWPMDFVMIAGNTPEEMEENKFKWTVNMSAKVERLRDFVGLENSNLLRIVATTVDIVKAKLGHNKKANVELVHQWLVDNVRWGAFHCPDQTTVQRHMKNWSAIGKNEKVISLIESAVQRWGRNNLLDWPSKLQMIVVKTDASTLGYVVEALFAHMWRKNMADPYGVQELSRVIAEILWVRSYEKAFMKAHPEVFQSLAASDMTAKAKRLLNSPLDFFLKTEGPDRDPTWLQSFQTDALRCYMKHSLELAQGYYAPEIKGALAAVGADRYSLDKFHKSTRVSQRFFQAFKIAYDSIACKPQAESADALKGEEESGAQSLGSDAGQDPVPLGSKDQEKQPNKELEIAAFRKACEDHCRRELESRLVTLTATGDATEINASVTSTRLYVNLTASAPVMGFYDVKNARLCNIYEGEGIILNSKPFGAPADWHWPSALIPRTLSLGFCF